MSNETLFAHLATKFATSPENLATEALAYVVTRSTAARHAMTALASQYGLTTTDDLHYSTQTVLPADAGIGDLVATDSTMMPKMIVEAKFWAGLTDNQPVKYLETMEKTGGGFVLFVCPERRARTLWLELLRRCREAGLIHKPTVGRGGDSEYRLAVTPSTNLGLTSWRHLLQRLISSAEGAGESASVSNLHQLMGLCDRMDSDAFLPIRSEELAPEIPRRLLQLCSVVDDVVFKLVGEGLASTAGLKASSGAGWYGRYFTADRTGALLHISAENWTNRAETPLWLRVKEVVTTQSGESSWEMTPALSRAIAAHVTPLHPVFEMPSYVEIALNVPIEVEHDRVLALVTTQAREIIEGINSALVASASEGGPST